MVNKYETLRIQKEERQGHYGSCLVRIFYLDKSELDFKKYYDIKLPDGKSFAGCSVYRLDQDEFGRSCDTVGFFVCDSLEAKLKEGYKMRVNQELSDKKRIKSDLDSVKKKMDELKKIKKELEDRI